METLTALSEWLAQTPLSLAIAEHNWAVPMLQSFHILAVAMVLSSVLMLDLRLVGVLGRDEALRSGAARFYPWIIGGLCLLVTTGIFQVVSEPRRELLNWIFWMKMGVLLTAVLVTLPARALLDDVPLAALGADKRARIRALALVSLVLWVVVVASGRLIAYAGDMSEG